MEEPRIVTTSENLTTLKGLACYSQGLRLESTPLQAHYSLAVPRKQGFQGPTWIQIAPIRLPVNLDVRASNVFTKNLN